MGWQQLLAPRMLRFAPAGKHPAAKCWLSGSAQLPADGSWRSQRCHSTALRRDVWVFSKLQVHLVINGWLRCGHSLGNEWGCSHPTLQVQLMWGSCGRHQLHLLTQRSFPPTYIQSQRSAYCLLHWPMHWYSVSSSQWTELMQLPGASSQAWQQNASYQALTDYEISCMSQKSWGQDPYPLPGWKEELSTCRAPKGCPKQSHLAYRQPPWWKADAGVDPAFSRYQQYQGLDGKHHTI